MRPKCAGAPGRRSRRDHALLDRLAGEGDRGSELGADRGLARALAQLSGNDRELLLLIAWEGLEPGHAALVLGCSRNALAVRLHRARKRLAAALSETDADDPAVSRSWAEEAR